MPLTKGESRRLSVGEHGWNLAVGFTEKRARTRGGGNGRLNRGRHADAICIDDSPAVVLEVDESSTESSEEVREEGSADEESVVVPAKKPPHARVMLEVSQLEEAFKGFVCPKCDDPLDLKLCTVCIATNNIELVCNNKNCPYVCEFVRDDQCNYERMTDYSVNVLNVLGFISVGDGHTEAGRMLGLLGLPNDTTMMNRSFSIIEERVGPFVRKLCKEIWSENI
jgi:hypothetical protein